jgi:dipeptidyl aminopeptidase/acylaminoacyl peptidase
VHGELDRDAPIHQAEELAQMARSPPKGRGAELVKLPRLNHLFVPATTGEVSEYPTLADPMVSPQLSEAVVDWLRTTFPPAR